jgi:hypothetical protein
MEGPRTGRFTYDAPTGKWDWDDEVFRIHGYAPGSLTPSTDVVLQHADEAEKVADQLRHSSRTGDPFSTSYPLKGADGIERRVIMVGEAGICDEQGNAVVEGFYVDVTEALEEESAEAARQAVSASAETRADIEQAKGVLMLAYGLDPDQAFAMLQWWSRNRNVKVRDLAARLVGMVREGELGDAEVRARVDDLLHDIATQA